MARLNRTTIVAAWVFAAIYGMCRECPARASGPTQYDPKVLTGADMSAWRGDTGDWTVYGDVSVSADDEKLLVGKSGAGTMLNGPKGRTVNLVSKAEFGDVQAHIEFMIPRGSNSGVYFMGRYEVQIYDSFGVEKDPYPGIECGGIYERWDDNRQPQGYEGYSPRVNASKPAGQWQSFDVVFRAPRFDAAGRKLTNARMEKVVHNGVVVHEDLELTGPTRAGMFADEKPTGPLMLQGDHGPVAYRNIRIAPAGPLPFFTFDNGMQDAKHPTIASQVRMVAELGYDGISGHAGGGLGELVAEMDKHGLRAHSVYIGVNIDEGQAPYGPEMDNTIEVLKGRNSILWVFMQSGRLKPSDPSGDARAAAILNELAGKAATHHLRIALYPHQGFWMETVEDTIRVATQVNRPNVGVTFNLCHFLRTDDERNMEKVLKAAMPRLFLVSINGADSGGKDWSTLIQTLDRGTFDGAGFLKMLYGLGYSGPVGLQCYGIGGDARDNLSRSIEAWRRLNAGLR